MHAITFGTDGIRGKADTHPFTSSSLFGIGLALARWAQDYTGKKNPRFLICGDTRASRERIIYDLQQGLLKFPITIINAEVLPTPALCHAMIRDKSFDVGIVISASHNPYYDNGIKIFGKNGQKLQASEEEVISRYYQECAVNKQYDVADMIGDLFLWKSSEKAYCSFVKSFFPKNFLHGLTVVLDCAQGATTAVAPIIFESLGAKVVTLANKPNGFNINENSGALHPQKLKQAVIDWKADIGFAFDGDGDRIIAVNKHGELRDGDDILFQMLSLPEYKDQQAVVGTVMTNQGFEKALENTGRQLIRTKVGDKHVVARLESDKLLLGGESSGHIVLKNYLPTCDAILCALMLVKSLQNSKNWDFSTFKKFPQALVNVSVAHKKDLTESPYRAIIEESECLLTEGRILVRYSGTKDLLRVMTEAQSYDQATSVAQGLAEKLQKALCFE